MFVHFLILSHLTNKYIHTLTNTHTNHSHISDHNRQILDAVGFHHDTCKVDRTQYVILISAVMCLSMFVRVDPKASDSSSTRVKMRRHSTFTIPDKRSSVVEVELGEIRNHTALRVEDDEEHMDGIGISTKESGDSDDSKEEDDNGTTTRLLIRRDSKGKLGIRFDDELVISHTNTWARSQGLRPNQKIVRCNDRVVRTHDELIEETSRHDVLDLHLKTVSSGALNNEVQDREVRILGDYVYDFFMTLIIICTWSYRSLTNID